MGKRRDNLKKLGPEIRVDFYEPIKKKKLKYKDNFPKDMKTIEDVKAQHGTVVWCKYFKCFHNQVVEKLQRTSGSILRNLSYKPIGEQEHVWNGICTRGEIAIQYDQVTTSSGNKHKIPHCFTSSTTQTGHLDFSKFLNSDGSPIGGSIESRSPDLSGYDITQGNNVWGV